MRARVILFLAAILVVAGFAALNWQEFIRPTPLSFGAFITDAPLGLIMLTVLAIATLAFVASAASMRTRHLVDSRHHYKTLEAQRDLADRAEASRFTDLRSYMDTSLRELRQRDEIAATEIQKAMVDSQRELRTQLEQLNRGMMARLAEIEARLDARMDRLGATPPVHELERPRADLEPPPRVRHPL